MPHLSIPRTASSDRAELWVAALNEPEAAAQLLVDGVPHPVPAAWQRWTSPDGTLSLRHQTVSIGGLAARRRYPVELRVAGQPEGNCELGTLPSRLPGEGETPFTVMLGSCFCRLKDEQGDAGARYARMPVGLRPDLNILCGDQVYLDSPWWRFMRPFGHEALARTLLDNYWRTWTQTGGFQEILRRGPNWFLGDDHEFWNNAPNRGAFPVNSWFRASRSDWLELARTFYRAFQSPAAKAGFSVGSLSFFLADTRINREEGRGRFMTPADLVDLGRWVDGLQAPGVLVVGQPIFTSPGSLTDRLADLGLPDYEQYEDLVRILCRTQHSLVILTGDVHFGRVARCSLASGSELIEIISSPLALVDDRAGKKWSPPPDRFPAVDVGIPPARIETADFREFADHFLTLEFKSVGSDVRLEVYYWPIEGTGRRRVFDGRLR